MTILCLVRAGNVVSRNDGDLHRVSASQLARLYGLLPGEWAAWRDRDAIGRQNLPVLGPRSDGNYALPEFVARARQPIFAVDLVEPVKPRGPVRCTCGRFAVFRYSYSLFNGSSVDYCVAVRCTRCGEVHYS